MTPKDIRWIQRLSNFKKAFRQLSNAVELSKERELTELEKQGVIQAFEYTHELAWNTLKDFLEERGVQNIYGSKDASREAFKAGLLNDGEVWMEMVTSRNQTVHTYNEKTVAEIVKAILGSYFLEFEALLKKLEELEAHQS